MALEQKCNVVLFVTRGQQEQSSFAKAQNGCCMMQSPSGQDFTGTRDVMQKQNSDVHAGGTGNALPRWTT